MQDFYSVSKPNIILTWKQAKQPSIDPVVDGDETFEEVKLSAGQPQMKTPCVDDDDDRHFAVENDSLRARISELEQQLREREAESSRRVENISAAGGVIREQAQRLEALNDDKRRLERLVEKMKLENDGLKENMRAVEFLEKTKASDSNGDASTGKFPIPGL